MEREQKQAVINLIKSAERARELSRRAMLCFPLSIQSYMEASIALLGNALRDAEKSGLKESIII